MAVINSRTREAAAVDIDYDRCVACGLCTEVCGSMTLFREDGRVKVDQSRVFGCIGCGQCMAACPAGCITVEGRAMSTADLLPLPAPETRASYESIYDLMLARRSIRRFTGQAVAPATIDKILAAAVTAPVSLPPSDVSVWMLAGREKVREFSFALTDGFAASKWIFSPLMTALMRPFIGKEAAESMDSFLRPFFDHVIAARQRGEDLLLYDAPLVMVFQGSPYASPTDPVLAAAHATLAAEALGLGSCMIGGVVPMLKQNRKLREKYGVRHNLKDGIGLIFGYPAVEYQRAVKRTFAHVDFANR